MPNVCQGNGSRTSTNGRRRMSAEILGPLLIVAIGIAVAAIVWSAWKGVAS